MDGVQGTEPLRSGRQVYRPDRWGELIKITRARGITVRRVCKCFDAQPHVPSRCFKALLGRTTSFHSELPFFYPRLTAHCGPFVL